MPRTEFLDRHEPKYHPSYEELLEESNARRIKNCLKGQLSCTTEEWLRMNKEDYIQ